VETERIAVAVRPRGSLEAADLGFRLARANFAPLFGAHALVVLSIAGALALALPDRLALVGALVWWLKPLYDRVALHVLSIALLGRPPGVVETLAALPRVLTRSGLLSSLTWLRLSPSRSFYAPVLQLEGLRGVPRMRRARVLAGRESTTAVGVLSVCGALELALFVAGLQLAATFEPEGALLQFWTDAVTRPSHGLLAYEVGLYALAVCAVEPLYVAAGFALYINRRVWLEGWDVELAFRRLERRVRAAAALAVLCLALAPALHAFAAEPAPRCAVDSAEDARACIDSVLAAPEFERTVKVDIWRPRPMTGSVDLLGPFWRWFGRLLAEVIRVGAWLGLPVILAILVVAIARGLRARRASESAPAAAPGEVRRGFDLRPESLPDDVLAAARARFAAGDSSGALSLLYRASLVELGRRFGLRLPASATEGECERIARGASDGALAQDFAALARAWLYCAYAHRPPAPDEFDALCARWAAGFGARR
jgi:hypothetical protein